MKLNISLVIFLHVAMLFYSVEPAFADRVKNMDLGKTENFCPDQKIGKQTTEVATFLGMIAEGSYLADLRFSDGDRVLMPAWEEILRPLEKDSLVSVTYQDEQFWDAEGDGACILLTKIQSIKPLPTQSVTAMKEDPGTLNDAEYEDFMKTSPAFAAAEAKLKAVWGVAKKVLSEAEFTNLQDNQKIWLSLGRDHIATQLIEKHGKTRPEAYAEATRKRTQQIEEYLQPQKREPLSKTGILDQGGIGNHAVPPSLIVEGEDPLFFSEKDKFGWEKVLAACKFGDTCKITGVLSISGDFVSITDAALIQKNESSAPNMFSGEQAPPKTHINSMGMEFVLIPAGSFMLTYDSRRGTEYKVTISKPFYLGKYTVTQEEWLKVMTSLPPTRAKGHTMPVTNMIWDEVQEFITRLNAKEKHARYRLPTEMEWEYAARGLPGDPYFLIRKSERYGEDEKILNSYAWFLGNSNDTPAKPRASYIHPVGQKKPNQYGLYDMYGNVREMMQDSYVSIPAQDLVDYVGSEKADTSFVWRGGSWNHRAEECLSQRLGGWKNLRGADDQTGFRLVLFLDDGAEPEHKQHDVSAQPPTITKGQHKDRGTPQSSASASTADQRQAASPEGLIGAGCNEMFDLDVYQDFSHWNHGAYRFGIVITHSKNVKVQNITLDGYPGEILAILGSKDDSKRSTKGFVDVPYPRYSSPLRVILTDKRECLWKEGTASNPWR